MPTTYANFATAFTASPLTGNAPLTVVATHSCTADKTVTTPVDGGPDTVVTTTVSVPADEYVVEYNYGEGTPASAFAWMPLRRLNQMPQERWREENRGALADPGRDVESARIAIAPHAQAWGEIWW